MQQRRGRPWEFHLQQSSIDPIMKACICLISLSQMLPVGKYIKCFLLGAGAEVELRVRSMNETWAISISQKVQNECNPLTTGNKSRW